MVNEANKSKQLDNAILGVGGAPSPLPIFSPLFGKTK